MSALTLMSGVNTSVGCSLLGFIVLGQSKHVHSLRPALTCQDGNPYVSEEKHNAAPALVLRSTYQTVDSTLLCTGCAVCCIAHSSRLVRDVRLGRCCVVYSGICVKRYIQGVNLLALQEHWCWVLGQKCQQCFIMV